MAKPQSTAEPHPSYQRLVRALSSVLGPEKAGGTTAIGDAFDGSPQLANNWPARGVPKARALEAQGRWGISAEWVLNNVGEMLVHGGSSQAARLNIERRTCFIEVVDEIAQASGKRVTPKLKARLVATLYADFKGDLRNAADTVRLALAAFSADGG